MANKIPVLVVHSDLILGKRMVQELNIDDLMANGCEPGRASRSNTQVTTVRLFIPKVVVYCPRDGDILEVVQAEITRLASRWEARVIVCLDDKSPEFNALWYHEGVSLCLSSSVTIAALRESIRSVLQDQQERTSAQMLVNVFISGPDLGWIRAIEGHLEGHQLGVESAGKEFDFASYFKDHDVELLVLDWRAWKAQDAVAWIQAMQHSELLRRTLVQIVVGDGDAELMVALIDFGVRNFIHRPAQVHQEHVLQAVARIRDAHEKIRMAREV